MLSVFASSFVLWSIYLLPGYAGEGVCESIQEDLVSRRRFTIRVAIHISDDQVCQIPRRAIASRR